MKADVYKQLKARAERTDRAVKGTDCDHFISELANAMEAVPDTDDMETIFSSAINFAYWESWERIIYHPEGIITVQYDVDGDTFTATFAKVG